MATVIQKRRSLDNSLMELKINKKKKNPEEPFLNSGNCLQKSSLTHSLSLSVRTGLAYFSLSTNFSPA